MTIRPRLLVGLLLGLLVACGTPPHGPSERIEPAPQLERSQTVPNEALNPDVRQETIHQTICVSGYTASVRPSSSYTNGIKAKLMREAGLPAKVAADYELDHRVPLALGGHPRNPANLALQPWDGADGAKRKDVLERRLHSLVCAGTVPLAIARWESFFDWRAAYLLYVDAR